MRLIYQIYTFWLQSYTSLFCLSLLYQKQILIRIPCRSYYFFLIRSSGEKKKKRKKFQKIEVNPENPTVSLFLINEDRMYFRTELGKQQNTLK